MPRNQGTSRKGKPGKRERAAGMGRALQRAQLQARKPNRPLDRSTGGMAMKEGVQSIGVEDGEGDRTKSVLELHDLDDFLLQAEMANRDFVSEREGLVVLDATGQLFRGRPSVHFEDEKTDFVFTELSVPRRPAWDETTTPQQLAQNENDSFLNWRRGIAAKEEELMRSQSGVSVTPFEKNLEVWRQLWRVLERSACLIQLVDARNPLFYLSEDLRDYANSLGKPMMVLVNKSDYLSVEQRASWKTYLVDKGWDPVFFSAYLEQEKIDKAAQRRKREELVQRPDVARLDDEEKDVNNSEEEEDEESDVDQAPVESVDGCGVDIPLTRDQLMNRMLAFAQQENLEPDPRFDDRIQFGMVGFPNVGKSSVINVLVGSSKHAHGVVRVGVAAQPGKTKHFQTLILPDSDQIMLCDCPGLVFPSFVSNTADLIAAGVYPIAQMRDHWPVVNLICQRIPRDIINAQYGIQMPVPSEFELNERGLSSVPPPTGEEFLSTLCFARGMLAASSGVPDYTRAARMVIKDYAAGKLLYCHPPPHLEDVSGFQQETVTTAINRTEKLRLKYERSKAREQLQAPKQGAENAGNDTDEVDIDMMDILGVTPPSTRASKPTNKPQQGRKKYGRKTKNRQEDPYGCHSNPDEMLDQTAAKIVGVSVKGKYSKKGYTRPTGHGFVRSPQIQ